jgi:hypothetical protein
MNTGAHFVSVLVKDQGILMLVSSSHTFAQVKLGVVGIKVGSGEGAIVLVGCDVGLGVTDGATVRVGMLTGANEGNGDGIHVPAGQVSSVGMGDGMKVGGLGVGSKLTLLGCEVGNMVGPTSLLHEP